MSVGPNASGGGGRVGIIGCGNIAPVYARTLNKLGVHTVVFADAIVSRAETFAATYGGAAADIETLIADDSLDAVVNLTPANMHADVTEQALHAGRNVFSEKPLAADFAQGNTLVDLSHQKGVRFGCAPDTFLGAGLQAARAAIDKGMIGEPIGANAFMLGFGPEWWHPNPEIFYGDGAGPLFDMGPYYLTALVHLLGPAASIMASAKVTPERIIHAKGRVGDRLTATAATHVASIIDFVSGPVATLVTSFDVKATKYRNIEIYGTEATLAVPDPNTFGGPLRLRGIINEEWRELPLPRPTIPQQRGIGLADMLAAQRAERPHRASCEQALHVLELMSGALQSSAQGTRVTMTTTCQRPAPIDLEALDPFAASSTERAS
jgi:predicted dehydrogenase